MKLPPMIGVTVVTPAYKHLEKEAVARFKAYTGLPVKVIRCKDEDGFKAKLELDRHCPKTRIVFFDVDLWLLRPMNPYKNWSPFSWMAVNDRAVFNMHAFPHTDCGRHQMNKHRYFNSGLIGLNLAFPPHREVFKEARRLRQMVLRKKLPAPVDVTDQFYLNKAVQNLNIGQAMMPEKFNFYMKSADWGQSPCIPREIVGLHAAGEPLKRKLRALKQQAAVFERSTGPMLEEAAFNNHNMIYDQR